MDTPNSHRSSSSSLSPKLPSTRAQRRGLRTTNACEACKKRKTRCSGPPGTCDACRKVETFCHFNARLDTRRKLAYKPAAVQERQQYILHGLLQILKFGDEDEILKLINLIRSEASPQDIASCLRENVQSLQGRGILQNLDIDETDIMSLGLQGLFSHRAGKPGPKQSPKRIPSSMQSSLTGSHEIRSRPKEFNDESRSTSSAASSQHGVKKERDDDLPSSLVENNLMSSFVPFDTMSLPSEDMNQSSSGVSSYTTTEDPFPASRDAAYGDTNPRYMPYHPHSLGEYCRARQWPSGNPAAGSIAPHLTFNEHRGTIAPSSYQSFESPSSINAPNWVFPGTHTAIDAGAYPSRDPNDFKGMQYELSPSHSMPYNDWNIPQWSPGGGSVPPG
ncbi:hypothetical protein PMZ80_008649 [Knufia obscura]|uniref:Zn(2)-C6 fungal-type domain-containing protein n=1 Tax=Knufia obscura TaxID=1635080 RepID=A0ABR0RFI1_9EURO|nr:hypothetical protein PMZ80_008649 [Knufia obscura]